MKYKNLKSDVLVIDNNIPSKIETKFLLYPLQNQEEQEETKPIKTFLNKINDDKSLGHHIENTVPKKYEEKKVNNLLPILDPSFNLREISKQIILLEDHLRNKEKQCFDCIIKHFLFIEGLVEETIGLYHSEDKIDEKILSLANKIRELQFIWHSNPEQNSIKISQELRLIRKEIMEPNFAIIFNNQSKYKSCSSSKCKI